MPESNSDNRGSLAALSDQVFQRTGVSLFTILKAVAVTLLASIGIGVVLFYSDAERNAESSPAADAGFGYLSDEEKFRKVLSMPEGFSEMLAIEKLSALDSKIELGEELVKSESGYAKQARGRLLFLYGTRCGVQEQENLNPQDSYAKLDGMREAALEAGDQSSVATADYFRATAAIKRLNHRSEESDFFLAADAVLKIDSANLTNKLEAKKLYSDAVKLHVFSSSQVKTGKILSLLAEKFVGSPTSEISDLGRNLRDYPTYTPYYQAVNDTTPMSTGQSRRQFYEELLAEVERVPPESPLTYRTIVELIDRLLNKTELKTAARLARRLGEAASSVDPKIRVKIDQSLSNLQKRISMFGETLDLSGSAFNGKQLKLPNGRPTVIVFWRPNNAVSAQHVFFLAKSEWLDPWSTNVLIACPFELDEDRLKNAGRELSKFTVLDNATSLRLSIDLGIDLVPYQVSLDKDGKVNRLGNAVE